MIIANKKKNYADWLSKLRNGKKKAGKSLTWHKCLEWMADGVGLDGSLFVLLNCRNGNLGNWLDALVVCVSRLGQSVECIEEESAGVDVDVAPKKSRTRFSRDSKKLIDTGTTTKKSKIVSTDRGTRMKKSKTIEENQKKDGVVAGGKWRSRSRSCWVSRIILCLMVVLLSCAGTGRIALERMDKRIGRFEKREYEEEKEEEPLGQHVVPVSVAQTSDTWELKRIVGHLFREGELMFVLECIGREDRVVVSRKTVEANDSVKVAMYCLKEGLPCRKKVVLNGKERKRKTKQSLLLRRRIGCPYFAAEFVNMEWVKKQGLVFGIFVLGCNGRNIAIRVCGEDTIADLKKAVFEKTGMSPRDQVLNYCGRLLVESERNLLDEGIGDGANIHLSGRISGGQGKKTVFDFEAISGMIESAVEQGDRHGVEDLIHSVTEGAKLWLKVSQWLLRRPLKWQLKFLEVYTNGQQKEIIPGEGLVRERIEDVLVSFTVANGIEEKCRKRTGLVADVLRVVEERREKIERGIGSKKSMKKRKNKYMTTLVQDWYDWMSKAGLVKDLDLYLSKCNKDKKGAFYPFQNERALREFFGDCNERSETSVLGRKWKRVSVSEICALFESMNECAPKGEFLSGRMRDRVGGFSVKLVREGVLTADDIYREKGMQGLPSARTGVVYCSGAGSDAKTRPETKKYRDCLEMGRMNQRSFGLQDTAEISDFGAGDVKMRGQSYAIPRLVDTWNSKAVPFDVLLESGRDLRELAGLDRNGPVESSDVPIFRAETIVMMRDGSRREYLHRAKEIHNSQEEKAMDHVVGPMAINVKGGICLDLKRKLIDYQNSVRHVVDSTDGGKAYLRIPFVAWRKSKKANVRCPVVSMGKHKAVSSVVATKLEEAMCRFSEEIENIIVNSINEGISEVTGEEEPEPRIGLRAEDFRRYVRGCKRVGQSKFDFLENKGTLCYGEGARGETEKEGTDGTDKPRSGKKKRKRDVTEDNTVGDPASQGPRNVYLPNRGCNGSIVRVAKHAHYGDHQDCGEDRGNQMISSCEVD